MSRNTVWRRFLLRQVIDKKLCLGMPFSLCNPSDSLISTTSPSSSSPSAFPHSRSFFSSSLSIATISHFQNLPFQLSRSLCSSSGQSNTVLIKSEVEFKSSLSKVKDDSLPAIFYFTAVWCGPCRLISPVLGELSQGYPHVTIYKIDIDQEGLGNILSQLNIMSVPTLHFFHEGKRAAEVIGADVARIKDTMEKLYK